MNKKEIKSNIEHFKKCVQEAIDRLGLYSYQYVIDEESGIDSRARIYYYGLKNNSKEHSRQFTISYNIDWLSSKETTKDDIRRTAFHEVLESMFSRLTDFANNKDLIVLKREVDSEVHEIIRTFENLILPLIPEK